MLSKRSFNPNKPRPLLANRSARRAPKKLRGDARKTGKIQSKYSRVAPNPRFQGAEPELKGFVYNLGYAQADTYVQTTKAIALYVGKTYNNGGDVKRTIDQLKMINLPVPAELPVAAPAVPEVIADPTAVPPIIGTPAIPAVPAPTPTEVRIWQREVDNYVKRQGTLERNLENLYSLIWLQCEPAMQDKVKTVSNYKTIKENCNSIALLKAIREITFSFESQRYQPLQIHELTMKFAMLKQSRDMTNSQYLEKFSNHVETMNTCGENIIYRGSQKMYKLKKLYHTPNVKTTHK